MRKRTAFRTAVAAVAAGVVVGIAPAALAWGAVGYVDAKCLRYVGTSTVYYGALAWNYTPLPGVGSPRNNFYVKAHGYLKQHNVNKGYVTAEGYGKADANGSYSPVTGDGSWVVDAYGWMYSNSSANQKTDRCYIT
ncbi:hypothetical protein GCM10009555_042150 [Acrocarpospora macrocephala]|uniref:Uncharacterized protein n=1 Tax=Acrocarpospora macrocephala TaxID=150177 RepID=A0A5M3WZG1_9ACTN|nr:hypothetical protein [Acrocarpospora macrocephala]GES13702.1 hypothetical protein Amac_072990 [Acrocarpospora macrocephala]